MEQDAEYARMVHEREEQEANGGGGRGAPSSAPPTAAELGLSEEDYAQLLASAGGPQVRGLD